MIVVKGIKQGKTIKLLEDVNIPDGQIILIEIQSSSPILHPSKRPSGLCEGEFIVPNDFDDPLPEDILLEFEET